MGRTSGDERAKELGRTSGVKGPKELDGTGEDKTCQGAGQDLLEV